MQFFYSLDSERSRRLEVTEVTLTLALETGVIMIFFNRSKSIVKIRSRIRSLRFLLV